MSQTQFSSSAKEYALWSAEDRRRIIRELIAHEDKLTTERTQSLYTIQGFLFAALGIIVGKGFPLPTELKLILTIVAAVGIMAAALYLREFIYNTIAILRLLDDWKEVERDYAEYRPPKVIGFESRVKVRKKGALFLTRKVIPTTLITMWVLVLVIVWLGDKYR